MARAGERVRHMALAADAKGTPGPLEVYEAARSAAAAAAAADASGRGRRAPSLGFRSLNLAGLGPSTRSLLSMDRGGRPPTPSAGAFHPASLPAGLASPDCACSSSPRDVDSETGADSYASSGLQLRAAAGPEPEGPGRPRAHSMRVVRDGRAPRSPVPGDSPPGSSSARGRLALASPSASGPGSPPDRLSPLQAAMASAAACGGAVLCGPISRGIRSLRAPGSPAAGPARAAARSRAAPGVRSRGEPRPPHAPLPPAAPRHPAALLAGWDAGAARPRAGQPGAPARRRPGLRAAPAAIEPGPAAGDSRSPADPAAPARPRSRAGSVSRAGRRRGSVSRGRPASASRPGAGTPAGGGAGAGEGAEAHLDADDELGPDALLPRP
eukprot:tig00000903_g5508.t1